MTAPSEARIRLGYWKAVQMQPGPSNNAPAGAGSLVRGSSTSLPRCTSIPCDTGIENELGYIDALDRCDSVDLEAAPKAALPPADECSPVGSPSRRQELYVPPPRAVNMGTPGSRARPTSAGAQRWGARTPSLSNPFKHAVHRPDSASSARPGSAASVRAHAIAAALQQAAIDRAPQERRRAAEHAPGLAMERAEGNELGGPDLTPKGPQGGEVARSPAGRELDSAGGLRDADGLEEVVRDLETRLERQEALRLRAERAHGSLAAHNAALREQVQDLVAQNREILAASRPGSAAGSRPGSAAPRGAASGPPRPHAAGMLFPDAAALARGGGLQPPPSSRAALASGSPPHRPPAEGRRGEPLRGVHRAWDGGAAPGGGQDAPKAAEPRSNGSSGFSGSTGPPLDHPVSRSPPARRTFRPASASAAGRWGGGGAPGAGGGGFGAGSLASRAVYVGRPARGAPGDGAAPALSPGSPGPGSPGKSRDELFSREHAQRLLRHSALSPGVGGRAERPGSAGRQGGSAGRAGTARPRSSHAERLLHRDADAFLGFHSAPAPPAGGGPDHALQVLVAMRARAAAKYVRVADSMVPPPPPSPY
jgi:hypothetical protein